jgi:hypothetical protein
MRLLNDRKKRGASATISLSLALMLLLSTLLIFHPTFASPQEGFLIITRQIFIDTLQPYIHWKEAKGFTVSVVTAEWIQQNIAGNDVRVKIRNCIRQHYYENNVKYVMLIGDSTDISTPGNETQPTPSLTEDWNLPAGYYWWNITTNDGYPLGAQYTSLYYSDLADKLSYSEAEFDYNGDYQIYVGIVPVRTPNELQSILSKTINYQVSSQATYVISNETNSPNYEALLSKILSLAQNHGISNSLHYFGSGSSSQEIFDKLFHQTGFVFEEAHGNLQLFKMADIYVRNENASEFKFINPLLITTSCITQAYQIGNCLDEAFLMAPKGPVTILGGAVPQGPISRNGELSDCERGFWTALFAGERIGKALYDNCYGAWQNPITLFGDPSLTIFGTATPSVTINGGDATTSSTSVTLSLIYPSTAAPVSEIRYSNDGIWDTELWETPSQNKQWTLNAGDGIKILYYQTKDDAGIVGTTSLASIILVKPTPTPTPLADYWVTVNAGTGGTISGGSGFTTPGTSFTYTITPNPGYQILDVKDNGVSKGAVSTYQLTNIQENHDITATFTTTLTPTPSPSPTPKQETTVTLTPSGSTATPTPSTTKMPSPTETPAVSNETDEMPLPTTAQSPLLFYIVGVVGAAALVSVAVSWLILRKTKAINN